MKTTLLQAANIMAPFLGHRMPDDREVVVDHVNRFRNLLYSSYTELKMFDEYEACIGLTMFRHGCDGDPCSTYYGFTLPPDMDGLIAVWESNASIDLRSRWRETIVGKQTLQNSLEIEVLPINGEFSTERDLTKESRLMVVATTPSDDNKVVSIQARTIDGRTVDLEFKISSTNKAIVDVKVCSIVSVVLPPDQCGEIKLIQEEDDYVLSLYVPGNNVPSYSRYKLIADCPTPCIRVQGTRQYTPLCHDTDIVEVGDRMILEAAGRYLRYHESLDSNEVNRSRIDRQEMFGLLDGYLARQRGKEIQDGPKVPPTAQRKRKRRRGLPGYRR